METKNVDSLNANPKNPRFISKADYANLDKTMDEFGDLSGIVNNLTTNQLVGGHQRTKRFKELRQNIQVVITQRFEKPNRVGTVAVGYIVHDGEYFAYREVRWDLARELAANVAANRISGEFNNDLLAEVINDIQQEDEALLNLTGLAEKEIEKLMKDSGVVDTDEDEVPADDGKIVFKLSDHQKTTVLQAIDHIRKSRNMPVTDHDSMNGAALYFMAEQYLAEAEPLTPEQDGSLFEPPEIPTIG